MWIITVVLLTVSNLFMTFAWYGQLYRTESLRWNYLAGFALIVAGAVFVFAPWR